MSTYNMVASMNESTVVAEYTPQTKRSDSYQSEAELEKEFTVVLEIEDANEDLAPVKLKNNAFLSPAETITTMYSLPSAKDIDPTPLTGFFYYLLSLGKHNLHFRNSIPLFSASNNVSNATLFSVTRAFITSRKANY